MADADFEDEHLFECIVATAKVINEGGLPHNFDMNDNKDKRVARVKVYYNLLKSVHDMETLHKVGERLSREPEEFIVNFLYAFIGTVDVHSFINETDDYKEKYTSEQYLYICHNAKHVHRFQQEMRKNYKQIPI